MVDDLKNIQRIVDIINSNPSILRQNNTDGLLRSVQFGNPAKMIKKEPKTDGAPYAYVTTSDSLQKTSYPFGVSSSSSLSQVTVEYKIVIVSEAKDKQVDAEKKLYNLLNLMRDTLTSDPTFKNPDSDDDPIFTRSIINQSQWDTKTKGMQFQIVEFTLIATIGIELTITIPGFGDLVILSDTGDDGRNNVGINNDKGDTKRSKGAFVGTRFFEYEYDTTTWEDLEALISVNNPLDLILQYPSGNITYTAKLEYQRQSKRFDGIRTVILQVNRETV